MKKEYLYSPGPTTVPPEALSVMGAPMFHHRTARFQALFAEVIEGLKDVLRTKNDVLVFAASGTGAMEASVANVCSPGDRIVTVNGGKFGERWGQIGRAYGLDVDEIMLEWGTAVTPAQIAEHLDGKVKAVYIQLCETSTAVATDVKAIAEVVGKTDAILVVDAISGLLCDELLTDEWGVDIVVGGSQKGMMIPPGLAFVSVSKKAWGLVEKAKLPTFYFSFKKYKKSVDKNDTPYTPAVSLIRAQRETLALIKAEGRDAMLANSAKYAEAIRAGMQAIGLKLLSQSPSNAVTAVFMPEGADGGQFVKLLRDKLGITFAGGQEALKGKIFRIASMGYLNQFDVLTAVSAVEHTLRAMGVSFTPGAAVKAAQEVLLG
jgi:aspartate aminotransferase-like enzyme